MKYRILAGAAAVMLLLPLTACGTWHNPEDSELPDLLREIYGGEFTVTFAETGTYLPFRYVDPHVAQKDPVCGNIEARVEGVYTVQDENGLEFHIVKQYDFSQGLGGHYRCFDDYTVQQFLAQTELYAALEQSPYACEYISTLGAVRNPEACFRLYIDNYNDVADAVSLAYETVQAEDARMPTQTDPPHDIDWQTVSLRIVLCTDDGTEFASVGFRRKWYANQIGSEAIAEKIEEAQCEYMQIMRETDAPPM